MDDTRKQTRRQRKAFEQRTGEDTYEYLNRTRFALRQHDLPRLYEIRATDPTQGEAIKLVVEIRTAGRLAFWTAMLAVGTLILGACTIVAAVIASR